MMPTSLRVAIVIPALNEELQIRGIVEQALQITADVIVIDDGSTDRTAELIADLPITLIRHATPHGKGEGLRAGFREALRRGLDGAVTMDGDGQHTVADVPRLLAAAQRFPGSLVIGARMGNRDNQPGARRRANAVADWGISWACGIPVADTQSGQRYYPRAALELVDLDAEDFVFEAAILIASVREAGLKVVSVPIETRYQSEFRLSHFRPVRDVTRITWFTIKRIAYYGDAVQAYRDSHATPAMVFDPPLSPAVE